MSVSGNEIGDLLVDIGIITSEELASAMEEQSRSGDRLTLILDRLGLVTYHQLKDSLELQFGVNFISLSKNVPAREIADLVSVETKYKFKLIPVASSGTNFTVAMVNPDDLIALDILRAELHSSHLKQLVCTADEFEFCMKELYEAPAAVVVTEETVVTTNCHTAELLSEEFTLPANVIAQADALEKKVVSRVPAKKHLQSLFGDDDDDDDDDMSSPPLASPTVASPTVAPQPVAPQLVAEVVILTLEEPSADARTQVARAETAMQAAVANVTSHLIESSLSALNANANRKLLEDVVESELGGSEEETDIHRMKEAQNASVMLLAHEIIGKATQKRCSDIHLEPEISGVSLRYFLHGELLANCMLPLEIHGALVGSYKVIAGLNPQELVKPQDKKFTTRVEEDEVELRITTIPTDNGEMVAISMRFIDPNSAGAIAQAKLSNLSED